MEGMVQLTYILASHGAEMKWKQDWAIRSILNDLCLSAKPFVSKVSQPPKVVLPCGDQICKQVCGNSSHSNCNLPHQG